MDKRNQKKKTNSGALTLGELIQQGTRMFTSNNKNKKGSEPTEKSTQEESQTTNTLQNPSTDNPYLIDAMKRGLNDMEQILPKKSKTLKKFKANEEDQGPTNGYHFYLNSLTLYNKLRTPNYIINFRQILYENLLKDPKEPRSLETAFMTSYGFETGLLIPIVKNSTVKVLKIIFAESNPTLFFFYHFFWVI